MACVIKKTVCVVLLSGFVATVPISPSQAQTRNVRDRQVNNLRDSAAPDVRPPEKDASRILANARTVYVWSRTVFVKQEVIESALLNRDDFRQSGLQITKDGQAADLVLTVRRANFTTEYPYDVVDQKTGLVVASGKVNSLFGTAAGKIAKGFTKQLQRARSAQDR